MKVVAVDNFDRDYKPDRPITVPGLPKESCRVIADALNAKYSGPMSDVFYRVVVDDYVLKEVDY